MLDAAAGPSRAHRLRLLRAGDDPLRARELQGFRFRAAARPGAAGSYAMQEPALGGLSARIRRLLCGPEPRPVRRRRQRAARLTARNRRSRPEIILGSPFRKGVDFFDQQSVVCRSGIGPEPEDTMTLYIIRGDRVAAYASAPARPSAAELRGRSATKLEASVRSNAQLAALWNALPGTTPVKKFKDRKTAVRHLWVRFGNPRVWCAQPVNAARTLCACHPVTLVSSPIGPPSGRCSRATMIAFFDFSTEVSPTPTFEETGDVDRLISRFRCFDAPERCSFLAVCRIAAFTAAV
jgi:hypothetical protein